MTPEQFCYWLQGFAETRDNEPPNAMQWEIITDHLNVVFNKKTPDRKVQSIAKLLQEEVCSPNPFDRPDVYCIPDTSSKRIC